MFIERGKEVELIMTSCLIYDLEEISIEVSDILANEFIEDHRLLMVDESKLVEHLVLCVLCDVYGIDFINRQSVEIARVREIMNRMPYRLLGTIRRMHIPPEFSGVVCCYTRRGRDLYVYPQWPTTTENQ